MVPYTNGWSQVSIKKKNIKHSTTKQAQLRDYSIIYSTECHAAEDQRETSAIRVGIHRREARRMGPRQGRRRGRRHPPPQSLPQRRQRFGRPPARLPPRQHRHRETRPYDDDDDGWWWWWWWWPPSSSSIQEDAELHPQQECGVVRRSQVAFVSVVVELHHHPGAATAQRRAGGRRRRGGGGRTTTTLLPPSPASDEHRPVRLPGLGDRGEHARHIRDGASVVGGGRRGGAGGRRRRRGTARVEERGGAATRAAARAGNGEFPAPPIVFLCAIWGVVCVWGRVRIAFRFFSHLSSCTIYSFPG